MAAVPERDLVKDETEYMMGSAQISSYRSLARQQRPWQGLDRAAKR